MFFFIRLQVLVCHCGMVCPIRRRVNIICFLQFNVLYSIYLSVFGLNCRSSLFCMFIYDSLYSLVFSSFTWFIYFAQRKILWIVDNFAIKKHSECISDTNDAFWDPKSSGIVLFHWFHWFQIAYILQFLDKRIEKALSRTINYCSNDFRLEDIPTVDIQHFNGANESRS